MIAGRLAGTGWPGADAGASMPDGAPGTPVPDARVLLRDGTAVALREVAPGDELVIREFLDRLCLETRRLRFFTGAADIGRIAHSVAATGTGRIGLIALDSAGRVVGHALGVSLDERRAEVAVEVEDGLHGRGLGTILVERLARLAAGGGTTTFVARVLPDNRPMLDVFRDGFDAHVRWDGGEELVEFPTAAWRSARKRFGRG